MNRIISKTAALVMASILSGAACMPSTTTYANFISSSTSDESKVEMEDALTIVKKRITIPKELSEFTYSTNENYGTKSFSFHWYTPDDADEYRRINVSITGGIITNYSDSKNDCSKSAEPQLAKLSNDAILKKAKEYINQLNPNIIDSVKLEIDSLELFSSAATVRLTRYENGIPVSGNNGSILLDKNTGNLRSFNISWWENAEFADIETAKTQNEIQTYYKSLCNLTPYYRISYESVKNESGKIEWKNVINIVYEPNMTSEIDAFTGKASTIWEDMNEAGGTRYYNIWNEETADAGAELDTVEEEEDMTFTPAELEKIQQDNNLVKLDDIFKKLKQDKYVALTDDYELNRYEINSVEDENKKEIFYLTMTYTVKEESKKSFNGYQTVSVQVNAETGEIIYFNKYNNKASTAKLDVAKAHSIAKNVINEYSKDIASQYKANSRNTAPVSSWKNGNNTEYESSRNFIFNRFVNGIQVSGDCINVEVDSNGIVSWYQVSHTKNVTFPDADILSKSKALEKLYSQQEFEYYYDGWITKDGKVKTYPVYKMDNFYLNAQTGKLCSWNGKERTVYVSAKDVKYNDINNIPQKAAIEMLQKYGVVLTTESRFMPNEIITEQDFLDLITSALQGYVFDTVEVVEIAVPAEKAVGAEVEAKENEDVKTTIAEAAVMFGKLYLTDDIAKLDIFKSPFSDVKSSNKNVGYIAIAKAKGFIKGTNGKLDGAKYITRAEAMDMLYAYLRYISK